MDALADLLCETLAVRVSCLSENQMLQLSQLFAPASRSSVQRAVRALEAQALIVRRQVLAADLELQAPLFCWTPGQSKPPPVAALSTRCRARWAYTSLQLVTAWQATPTAGARWGVAPTDIQRATLRPSAARHDLCVSDIFINLCRCRPEQAAVWIPEARLAAVAHPGERIPDALLLVPDAPVAIEFGGACLSRRIQKLVRFGERYQAPWELW